MRRLPSRFQSIKSLYFISSPTQRLGCPSFGCRTHTTIASANVHKYTQGRLDAQRWPQATTAIVSRGRWSWSHLLTISVTKTARMIKVINTHTQTHCQSRQACDVLLDCWENKERKGKWKWKKDARFCKAIVSVIRLLRDSNNKLQIPLYPCWGIA